VSGLGDLNLIASTALVGSLAIQEAPWPAPADVPEPVTGRPQTRLLPLVDDGLRSAGLWSCTPGAFRSDHTGYVEFMHVIDGMAELRGDDGTVWHVSAGTVLVIPDGWVGTWVVEKKVIKSYAMFRDGTR
jgi:uncharacterized cupin superfamily protein